MFEPDAIAFFQFRGEDLFQDLGDSGFVLLRRLTHQSITLYQHQWNKLAKRYPWRYDPTTRFTLEILPIGTTSSLAPDCKFAWKMEGVDEDWTLPTSFTRPLTYASLPSGNYSLEIKNVTTTP